MTEGVRIPPIDLVVDTGADPDTLADPDRAGPGRAVADRRSTPRRVGDTYRLDFGEGTIVRGEMRRPGARQAFAHRWAWDGAEPRESRSSPGRRAAGRRIADLAPPRRLGRGGPRRDARDDHAAYWAGYLEDLRDVLEEA